MEMLDLGDSSSTKWRRKKKPQLCAHRQGLILLCLPCPLTANCEFSGYPLENILILLIKKKKKPYFHVKLPSLFIHQGLGNLRGSPVC